jgi:hypothetical protein
MSFTQMKQSYVEVQERARAVTQTVRVEEKVVRVVKQPFVHMHLENALSECFVRNKIEKILIILFYQYICVF